MATVGDICAYVRTFGLQPDQEIAEQPPPPSSDRGWHKLLSFRKQFVYFVDMHVCALAAPLAQ